MRLIYIKVRNYFNRSLKHKLNNSKELLIGKVKVLIEIMLIILGLHRQEMKIIEIQHKAVIKKTMQQVVIMVCLNKNQDFSIDLSSSSYLRDNHSERIYKKILEMLK